MNKFGKGVTLLGYFIGMNFLIDVCKDVRDVMLVTRYLMNSKGITKEMITKISDAKMEDGQMNDYYKLKARELRGRRLTNKESKKLLKYDSIILGSFEDIPIS